MTTNNNNNNFFPNYPFAAYPLNKNIVINYDNANYVVKLLP